ncbi:MAG: glucose-1-phosphate thymidylyltransferase [Bacteroidetes bacterium HGW-Bacteroidetes-1]|jgi:UDP-N-acetylglucosamine diphosphorylase/glucosamine-1-phosphate N-acetyltransferase|nr:MAG: glucose-1-phosphate thymidylyltransferase [Bacteroidetes bacterium HGW-Bacteroidetes-1]
MNFILFDSTSRTGLLPLTFTRPVADIRFGILTIREKWEMYLKSVTSSLTEDYLSIKYPLVKDEINMLINGSICPTKELVKQVNALKEGQALIKEETIIAMCLNAHSLENIGDSNEDMIAIECKSDFLKIQNTWDIFNLNDQAIKEDFALITKGRKSKQISETNRCINPERIFVEEGAIIEFAILNASSGPIYIGKGAQIMEGCIIRGSFALCDYGVLKMGAKIYGPVTIGPYSKVGGEVSSSVIFGFTNKSHDGFLGHSVLGEWCNLGADTNNSNLKNTYEEVKVWSYAEDCFVQTGLQFCGTIMGDHTKCGINTMFNTGTVVGVNSNIYGSGFQRNFVPSFSWGGTHGLIDYDLKKAIKTAEIVYARRNKNFDKVEKAILTEIYSLTYKNRRA